MSQNYFWFRTCFLAKKQCAPARQKFWIPLQSRQKILGRRFAPSAWIHRKNRWVPYWCLYCTKLALTFKTNDVARAERVVAWNWIVRSDFARLFRSLRSREQKPKIFLPFLLFLGGGCGGSRQKMERKFLVFAPATEGSGRGAQNPSVRFSFKPPRAPRVPHHLFWK